jgi:hypothetical protein
MFKYFACKSFGGTINYLGEVEVLSNDECKINWYVDILFNQHYHHTTQPIMIEYAGKQYILTNMMGGIHNYDHIKKNYDFIPLNEIKKGNIKKKVEIKLIGNEEDILFLKSSVEFQEVISRLGIELKD